MTLGDHFERELAIVKLKLSDNGLAQLLSIAEEFGAEVLDNSRNSCTVQLTGRPSEVDAFVTAASACRQTGGRRAQRQRSRVERRGDSVVVCAAPPLVRLMVACGSSPMTSAGSNAWSSNSDPPCWWTLRGSSIGLQLSAWALELSVLRRAGHEVLLVSSGAVAIGCNVLSITRRRARLDELQAAAAAGQVQLVQAWQEALARHDIRAAQILLTPDDTENRRRFLNARSTLAKLLELDVIPVINENDTVATDELRYGDNDRLAARVAQMVMADGLVLLSDVDGLYSADPGIDCSARHIPLVGSVTADVMDMAGKSASAVGSGGMRTKLQAARIATHAGCATIVASGRGNQPLAELFAGGGKCTVFEPEGTPAAARKQWLAGILDVGGELHVDAGAETALANGSSLLPVGLSAVVGAFGRGDVVSLIGAGGRELGRGLVTYSSEEAAAITGCRSEDIEARLGFSGRSVLVHRDDLVLFGAGRARQQK